jgi:hypothetical protein
LPQLPPPSDQPAWDKAATDAAVGQLAAVRSTAEKWAGTVTALLGVFSSVAVITGTDALKDVRWQTLRIALAVAIGVAGVFAFVSIVQSARAAQGSSKTYDNWNGDTLRAVVAGDVPAARTTLRWSKIFGVAAAVLVFAVGMVSVIASTIPKQAAGHPTVLVVDDLGNIHCGDLGGTAKAVTVGGASITGAKSVQVIDNC